MTPDGNSERRSVEEFRAEAAAAYEKLFAENKIDSMFTPGTYKLRITAAHKKEFASVRDSLYSCQGLVPAMNFAENGEIKPMIRPAASAGNWEVCTEDSPLKVWYDYEFVVNDSAFKVRFLSWNEKTNEYDNVIATSLVSFGKTPVAPEEAACPESDSVWTVSCAWSPEFKATYADADYKYVAACDAALRK